MKMPRVIIPSLIIYIIVGLLVASSIWLFGKNFIDSSLLTAVFIFLWPLLLFSTGATYHFAFFTVIFFSLLIVVLSREEKNNVGNDHQKVSPKTRIGRTAMLAISIIFVSLITLSLDISREGLARFDLMHVPPVKDFTYKDSLTCTIVYSTFKDIGESRFRLYSERTFVLRGLQTSSPQIEQAGFSYQLQKDQEGPDAVIFTAAPIGTNSNDGYSLESIQIFKNQGTFVRSFMGFGQYFGSREMYYPNGFQYVIAQKGKCE